VCVCPHTICQLVSVTGLYTQLQTLSTLTSWQVLGEGLAQAFWGVWYNDTASLHTLHLPSSVSS